MDDLATYAIEFIALFERFLMDDRPQLRGDPS